MNETQRQGVRVTQESEFASTENEGFSTLGSLVGFMRRRWRIISVGTLCGLAVAGAWVVLMTPEVYQAAATLVVVPPPFSSELTPQTLTVQGYQQILESDAVVAEAKRRLVQEGILPSGAELRVGYNLASEIFVSRRAEERELAPLLKATVTWADPEVAATVSNTWAHVFLGMTGDLVRGSTSPTVAFLEEQYPISSARLAESENARVSAANDYQEELDATFTGWDRRITEFKNQITKDVAEYRAETHEIIETHMAETNLETIAKQLEALRTTFSELQREQASVESMVEQRRLELEAGRAQLSQTPAHLDLNKAITDDALWQIVTKSGKDSVDWDEVRERTLVTQVVNPVYSTLASTVATIEMDLRALLPRARQLEERLERLASQLQTLEVNYRKYEAERERLVQERDAGVQVLMESGTQRLGAMERDRNRAVQAIVRERDARLAQLDRDIEQQKALHKDLGENYNQALVAKAQTDVEDVRLGAPAVPPERPLPSHYGLSLLLGAVLGATFGMAAGLVRDVGQA